MFDLEPYTVTPAYLNTEDSLTIKSGDHDYTNFLFACHMHKYAGDRTRCAEETLRRLDLCRAGDPGHPCFVHLCRIRPAKAQYQQAGLEQFSSRPPTKNE